MNTCYRQYLSQFSCRLTPSARFGAPLCVVLLLLCGAMLSTGTPAQAQEVSPESITCDADDPVCQGESKTETVSITLPVGSTADKVDIVLLLDDTGSFASQGPIVADNFAALIGDLEAALPEVDFGFGVTRYEDFGGIGQGFGGATNDRPFILNQAVITVDDAGGITQRNTLIEDALNREAPGFGGDGPESAAEGLFQIATGVGFDADGDGSTLTDGNAGEDTPQTGTGARDVPEFSSYVGQSSGALGGVGWREDAQKIVLLATDVCNISAFDSADGIADEITGAAGATEPVSVFACTNLNPGTSRFGFVSDAKTTSDNTISGAIAPEGAGTLQSAVSALNSLGIQVVGISSGSGATDDTGPAFGPDVFLSGLARLTGALDSDGDPIVLPIGGDITAALLEAIETTTTAEVDIALDTTELPDGLTVDFDPTLVEDVGPGGTATFDVTFSGDGTAITGDFALQFKNNASNAVLGSIPVTMACEGDICAPPTIAETVNRDARTITIEVTDPEGIASAGFVDPEGNTVLVNLTASLLSGALETTDGINWTAIDPANPPTAATFELAVDEGATMSQHFITVENGCGTSLSVDPIHDMPSDAAFAVKGGYPNPFAGQTTIEFVLSEPDVVRIDVFNALGQQVTALRSDYMGAGSHEVQWDGTDSSGRALAPGVYFVRINTSAGSGTARLIKR